MRIAALALPLLLAGNAMAQNPDLAVYLDWVQIEDTTTVKFTLTVENVSDSVTFDPSTWPDPIDWMLLPDLDTQPDPLVDGSIHQGIIDAVLAPGQSWTVTVDIDYEIGGSFTAWAIVDTLGWALPQFGFPEVTKENNIDGPVPVTVEAILPELDAELTCTLSVQVVANQPIYEVVLQNIGPVPAPDCFKVDVLHDSLQCPPPEWNSVPNTKFGDVFADVAGGLAAGETKELIIPGGVVTPGTHNACALVDLENCVVEGDEVTNNVCGPAEYTIQDIPDVAACDLDVTVFTVSTILGQVNYTVEVKNIGDKACPGFTVDLWYHLPEAPEVGIPASDFATVNNLPVNDTWSHTFTQLDSPNGQYSAWVWADPANVTDDSGLDNNVQGPFPYQVAVPNDDPDLVVIDVEWEEIFGQVCFDVTVRNQGTGDAEQFPVDVFYSWPTNPNCYEDDLSQASVGSQFVDLPAGAQKTLEFCWEDPADGAHSAWVKIDCLNSQEEGDKTNNDHGPIEFDYEIVLTQGVDLKAVEFKAKVSCTLVSYSGKCRNGGDETAGPFQIDIFYNSETNPNFNPPGDFTLFHPADPEDLDALIGPGQQVDIGHNRSFESGTYRSWFVCDTNNDVDEHNDEDNAEGNNISFVEFVVDEESCRCADNVLIEEACACGGETVFDGYCCNGEWGFEEFDECGDGPADGDADTGDDVTPADGDDTTTTTGGEGLIPGEGSRTSLDITTDRTTTTSEGCAMTPTGAGGAAGLVLLTLMLLGVLRRDPA